MRTRDVIGSAGGLDVKALVFGVSAAIITSVVVAALIASLMQFTSLTEEYLPIILHYLGLLVVLAGGAAAARRAMYQGWLHGGFAGLAMMSLVLLVTALAFPGSLESTEVARQATIAFLAGALGGVIGVNL